MVLILLGPTVILMMTGGCVDVSIMIHMDHIAKITAQPIQRSLVPSHLGIHTERMIVVQTQRHG